MSMVPTKQELADFFNENREIITLPIHVDKGSEVFQGLFSRWDDYTELVHSVPWLSSKISQNIDNSVDCIKKAINCYFSGDTDAANREIRSIMDSFKCSENSYLITKLQDLYIKDLNIDGEYKEWYRARLGDMRPFSREDMYHISYSNRAKIKNQRYSINGIPCLYLGKSIYACWEELKRPSLDSLWVSRYEPSDIMDMSILNLSVTAGDIINNYVINEKLFPYNACIDSFFSAWILQSTCSVVVDDNGNRTFREEYVIPQLLMQNIKDEGLGGILYFSNQLNNAYSSGASWILKNLAVPAFDFKDCDNGYSNKILDDFRISYPLNVGMYERNVLGQRPKIIPSKTNLARTSAPLNISGAYNTCYSNTPFYRCEIELTRSLYYDDANNEKNNK